MSSRVSFAANSAAQVSSRFAQSPQAPSAVVASSKSEPGAAQSSNAMMPSPRANSAASNYFAKADTTQAKLRQTLPTGSSATRGRSEAGGRAADRNVAGQEATLVASASTPNKPDTTRNYHVERLEKLTTRLHNNPADYQAYHELEDAISWAQIDGDFHNLDAVKGAQLEMASAKDKAQAAWDKDFKAQFEEAAQAVWNVTEPFRFMRGSPTEAERRAAYDAVNTTQATAAAAPDESARDAALKTANDLYRQLLDSGVRDPQWGNGLGDN